MEQATEVNPFIAEYEAELETWLRRRFSWLSIVLLSISILICGMKLIPSGTDTETGYFGPSRVVPLLTWAGALGWVAIFYVRVRPRLESRAQLLRASSLMLLGMGSTYLAAWLMLYFITPELAPYVLMQLFMLHLTACLFLPWTPLESVRPMAPLLAVWIVATLILELRSAPGSTITAVIFAPLIFVPGALISHLRLQSHRARFRVEMVGRDLLSLRREMSQARRIHESMFPPPYNDGYVRVDYTYVPQRDIGGDYLHMDVSPTGQVFLTLLDVTGHGLAAAMTVNRLYGEIERIRAERPKITPGEMLGMLNRYVHLTLARHNIYVTGVCISFDPYTGKLTCANAGHPPVFLRRAHGEVIEMYSTSVLLGPMDDTEFDKTELDERLGPGDVLLIYTDGAFEACNRRGERLGLKRLRELMRMSPPPAQWPQAVTAAVQRHQAGRSEDDVLVAALSFQAARGQGGRTASTRPAPAVATKA